MFDSCRNLTYNLTHQIGSDIVSGRYKEDSAFPTEAELCNRYNISRNVIREAIKMLAAKGLLASRQRTGIQVLSCEKWNMFDADVLSWTVTTESPLKLLKHFTQLRLAVEPEAARLAAQIQSPQISLIENSLRRMKSSSDNANEYLAANVSFHTSILVASNNPYFSHMQQFIEPALRFATLNNHLFNQPLNDNIDAHQKIANSIIRGNSAESAKKTKALLVNTLAIIDSTLRV